MKQPKKKPGLVPDSPPPGEPPPAVVKKKTPAEVSTKPKKMKVLRRKKKRASGGNARVVSAVVNVATKGLRPLRGEEAVQLRDFVGRALAVVTEKAKQIVVAGDASERLVAILTKPV